MDSIEYNGKWYNVRCIDVGNLGMVYIASTDLSDKLISYNGSPVSQEANWVDEQICFYIDPALFGQSDKELKKILL